MSRKKRSHAKKQDLSVPNDPRRQQLGWYVRNCFVSSAAGALSRMMLGRLNQLRGKEGSEDIEALTNAEQHRRQRELRLVLKDFAEIPKSEEDLERNALFASDEFGLDEIDTEILLLLLRCERHSDLDEFVDEVFERLNDPSRAIGALIGADPREVRSRIAAGGTLIGSGVVSVHADSSFTGFAGQYFRLAPPLRKAMHRSYTSREEWVGAIIGQPAASTLTWKDFEHLGTIRDLAARVVTAAGKRGEKGINLLLYGPVGTGKTEFSKVLAARTGANIWSVGETDDEGGEPTRAERLASLKIVQWLLAKRKNGFILFDEAEDLLASVISFFEPFASRRRDGSKVYINRMMERNPIPILWTCNDVSAIDPAVLRRMTLAIEIKTPDQPVRARIWQRALSEALVTVSDDAICGLSARYEAPPAIAANAVRVAALSGGGEKEIEEALGGVLQVLGIGPRVPDSDGRDFDPALINCREDLTGLADRLVLPGTSRKWSLCLHGAPGTGKSQFARYLARRLDIEIMQRRASDLLSPWGFLCETIVALEAGG